MRELLESKENVVIMSHKIPDPDAMGAAGGIIPPGAFIGQKGPHRHERGDNFRATDHGRTAVV